MAGDLVVAAGFLVAVVAADLVIGVGLDFKLADSGSEEAKLSYGSDAVLSGVALGEGVGDGSFWLRVPSVGVELSSQPLLPNTQL